MNKIKYILFAFVCMFCSCVVFAEGEIVVKSITPVYDETSEVEVSDNGIIFNDKDQEVKYNVVLENKIDKDLTIENINLSKTSEEFLIYEIEGLKDNDVLKANSSKEFVVSFSTVVKEHWGRNFNDELTANISFDDGELNPNTSSQEIILLLILTIALIVMLIIFKNKKISRYVVFIIIFGSFVSVIKAKIITELSLKFNVSYESQTMMKPIECQYFEDDPTKCENDYFYYGWYLKGFYIEDELNEPDSYIEKYDMSDKQDGSVVAYLVENKDNEDYYDVHLQGNGIIYLNENSKSLFDTLYNLDFIDNIRGLDTSKVIDMSNMFYDTGSNSTVFTLDVSHFDTSNVINMSNMFWNAGSSNPNFTLDVSNFDTSNVIDMTGMFSNTGSNSTVFTLDVSNFDTSNVTSMRYMFHNVGRNNILFTLDVSNFDTSKVTDMVRMFDGTGYNSTIFTLDVSHFDTRNVTNIVGMFDGTGYNSTKLNTSITIRNPNIEEYNRMFRGVATKPGSKITVNYTSETSDLVDQMLLTKTDGANVVKGVLVD